MERKQAKETHRVAEQVMRTCTAEKVPANLWVGKVQVGCRCTHGCRMKRGEGQFGNMNGSRGSMRDQRGEHTFRAHEPLEHDALHLGLPSHGEQWKGLILFRREDV